MSKSYNSRLLDVKMAFLYGMLDEELILTIQGISPERIQKGVDWRLFEVSKTFYGLVQAAREWWKTFVKTLMDDLDFEQFQSDSCLLNKKNNYGFVAIGIYVDDCLLIGDTNAINEFVEDMMDHYEITTEEVSELWDASLK